MFPLSSIRWSTVRPPSCITAPSIRAISLTLRLQPDPEAGSAAEFSPGQYMELTLPGTDIRRAYSLANLPNWEGRLDFLIRLQPGGTFSTWLGTQARVGDVLSVRGPLGSFVLDEVSVRPRCFVGGGCGLASLDNLTLVGNREPIGFGGQGISVPLDVSLGGYFRSQPPAQTVKSN